MLHADTLWEIHKAKRPQDHVPQRTERRSLALQRLIGVIGANGERG